MLANKDYGVTSLKDFFLCNKLVSLAFITYIVSKLSPKINYYVKFFVLFTSYFILMCMAAPVALITREVHSKNLRFSNIFGLAMHKLCGVNHSVRGQENVKSGRGAIMLMNHQTSLDLALGGVLINHVYNNIAMIAKKEIQYIFPFGLIGTYCGGIFIDRKNRAKAVEKMSVEMKRLKSGTKIVIFPEGTRNDSEILAPFKKGAFHLAIETQAPIQPVVISRYDYIDHKKKIFGRGQTVIKILPEIATEGLTKDDLNSLIARVQNLMQNEYTNLNYEIRNNK